MISSSVNQLNISKKSFVADLLKAQKIISGKHRY